MDSIRLVPVLDLKGGLAVHAVRGQRHAYAPVRSVLSDSPDPGALARAFRDRLGCRACYVADLDAITGVGDHAATIRRLAALDLAVWLDAGVTDPVRARWAVDLGVARVIVGTETLADPAALAPIVDAVGAAPGPRPTDCALSLDFRDGALLGATPAIARLEPLELARTAWEAGVRAFITLELGRVGSGGGPDPTLARQLRSHLPAAEIVVGGGVRHAADLEALAVAGCDAALVATALHTGAIGAQGKGQ
jgi:phosphoribosylformimino-5-aminoimidazole carboxamide ribotide isomerase